MEALGIPRGSYVVKVNNRKVLDGVMESIGLGGDENAGNGSPCCARSTSSIVSASRALQATWLGDGMAAKKEKATSPRARDSEAEDIARDHFTVTKAARIEK